MSDSSGRDTDIQLPYKGPSSPCHSLPQCPWRDLSQYMERAGTQWRGYQISLLSTCLLPSRKAARHGMCDTIEHALSGALRRIAARNDYEDVLVLPANTLLLYVPTTLSSMCRALAGARKCPQAPTWGFSECRRILRVPELVAAHLHWEPHTHIEGKLALPLTSVCNECDLWPSF